MWVKPPAGYLFGDENGGQNCSCCGFAGDGPLVGWPPGPFLSSLMKTFICVEEENTWVWLKKKTPRPQIFVHLGFFVPTKIPKKLSKTPEKNPRKRASPQKTQQSPSVGLPSRCCNHSSTAIHGWSTRCLHWKSDFDSLQKSFLKVDYDMIKPRKPSDFTAKTISSFFWII